MSRRTGSHPDEIKKIVSNTMRKIKREFRKYGDDSKFIYRVEIGKRGAIHVHLLINEIYTNVPQVATDKIVAKYWKLGKVHFKRTYEEGGFEKLAEYLCKNPDESDSASEESKAKMYPYVPSRNLDKPEKIVKVYKRQTVRKLKDLIKERMKNNKVHDGYILDVSSVAEGRNPWNGLSFLRFIELRN